MIINSEEIVSAVKNFTDEIKSRATKDTLIASYAISFIFYNWKAMIFLFDFSLTSYDKIEDINEVVFGNKICGISLGFVIPLLAALFYMFIYTRISVYFESNYRRYAANKAFRILGINHEGNQFEKSLVAIRTNHEEELKKKQAQFDIDLSLYTDNINDLKRENSNLLSSLESSLLVLEELLKTSAMLDVLGAPSRELEEVRKIQDFLGIDTPKLKKSNIERLRIVYRNVQDRFNNKSS